MVRDPNVMPAPMVFLVAVSGVMFLLALVKQWVDDRPWKRHAKSVKPIVFDRQMVERMRQSATERMGRS